MAKLAVGMRTWPVVGSWRMLVHLLFAEGGCSENYFDGLLKLLLLTW